MMRNALVTAMLVVAPLAVGAQTINLWPGVAPGSEHWKQKEVTYENTPVGTVIQNVVTPTITVFLPQRSKATGAGIIVAPGGGFVALATTNGGTDVARWLQARGVAAFLLKYRTIEKKVSGIPRMDQDTAGRYGIADALQAVRVVRQHATEWHLQSQKIGIIGFSAGGMVASSALIQGDATTRPNFAALIYGAPFGVLPKISAKLPPVFMAWAKDDGIATAFMPRFAAALRSADSPLSEHIYVTGGHGFGIAPRGKAADRWPTDFEVWLRGLGMIAPQRTP